MISLSEISNSIPNRKIVLGVVAAIIVGEIIWAGWTLLKPTSGSLPGLPKTTTSKSSKASISLQADKVNLKVGQKVAITANILSVQPVAGVDLILNFDPKILAVESASSAAAPMLTSSLLDSYPLNQLDEIGKIFVSGISSTDGGKVLNGPMGTVNFVAKAVGETQVTIGYVSGSTIDSNVTQSQTAKDLLDEVKNVELNITQ